MQSTKHFDIACELHLLTDKTKMFMLKHLAVSSEPPVF